VGTRRRGSLERDKKLIVFHPRKERAYDRELKKSNRGRGVSVVYRRRVCRPVQIKTNRRKGKNHTFETTNTAVNGQTGASKNPMCETVESGVKSPENGP